MLTLRSSAIKPATFFVLCLFSIHLNASELIGSITGFPTASYSDMFLFQNGIVVSNNQAYMATASGLSIIDVSNSSAPRLNGELPLSTAVSAVSVYGSLAYITTSSGLQIINVSNPTNPTSIGSVANSIPSDANGLVVAGDIAYFIGANYALNAVNVTDRMNPRIIGSLSFAAIPPSSIALSGNCAYVTLYDSSGSSGALQIINISNPSAPTSLGAVTLPIWAAGVAVSHGYAYVAMGKHAINTSGLSVVNVTNPLLPEIINSTIPHELQCVGCTANAITLLGDCIYIVWYNDGGANGGFWKVDISNPILPIVIDSYSTQDVGGCPNYIPNGWMISIATVNDLTYVVLEQGGGCSSYPQNGNSLLIFGDSSAPATTTVTTTLPTATTVSTTAATTVVTALPATTTDSTTGVTTGPSETPINVIPVPYVNGTITSISAAQNYVYLVGNNWLVVIDTSTQKAVGKLSIVGALSVQASGSFAYVTVNSTDSQGAGIVVVNVVDPEQPVEVGFLLLSDVHGIGSTGNHTYVTRGSKGIQVIGTAIPTSPQLDTLFSIIGNAESIAVRGGYAYVTTQNKCFDVINITNPSAPALLSSIRLPYLGINVAVSDSCKDAYVSTGSDVVEIVDVANPLEPIYTASIRLATSADGIACVNGYIIAGSNSNIGNYSTDSRTPNTPTPVPVIDSSYSMPWYQITGIAVSGVAGLASLSLSIWKCSKKKPYLAFYNWLRHRTGPMEIPMLEGIGSRGL